MSVMTMEESSCFLSETAALQQQQKMKSNNYQQGYSPCQHFERNFCTSVDRKPLPYPSARTTVRPSTKIPWRQNALHKPNVTSCSHKRITHVQNFQLATMDIYQSYSNLPECCPDLNITRSISNLTKVIDFFPPCSVLGRRRELNQALHQQVSSASNCHAHACKAGSQ